MGFEVSVNSSTMEPIAHLCKRPKPSSGVDATADGSRFSDLPEQVVHHIFSFLETIDVIRASAVSRQWRYLWTSTPHLKFVYDPVTLNPLRRYNRFKDFINWVLMAHDKSVSIQSFHLSCSKNEDDHSLYRWLYILSQKHVQELTFHTVSDKPFALPRCLFVSDSLEALELDLLDGVLKIPTSAGFSRLKSLKLVRTILLDQNLLQNFISSCHLIENLSFESCVFHFKVLDISSRTLRKFVSDRSLNMCDLKIDCPNLVYFDLTGHLVNSLSWGKSPSFMQTAIIFAYRHEDLVLTDEFTNFVLRILKGVCHVKDLKLRMNILEYISPAVAKPGCFSIIFSNLTTLRLSTSMEACHIQSIIHLLKRAPNLQLLSVYIECHEDFEGDYKCCKILDEDIECLTCHLKMVKLIHINGSDAELELIRFFLKNAHVLEKMSIIWGECLGQSYRRDGMRKVMKFLRSSSHVNITFSKPKQFSEYKL